MGLRSMFGGKESLRNVKPKYFAPYSVWSVVRSLSILAFSLYVLAILLAAGLAAAWPLLLLVPAIILAPPFLGALDDRPQALTLEFAGLLLGSSYCPACGQSIFDDAPSSGYISDLERAKWWPRRICANCGHDLKVRDAE